jgi:PcRGLX-like protein central beta sandwich domain
VLALQDRSEDGPERFRIGADNVEIKKGTHLGGWMAVEEIPQNGRGVAVSLRHMWQMFPSALALEQGALNVKLWPGEAGRMGFEYKDIMPNDFYANNPFNNDEWDKYEWSKPSGHFEHEFASYGGFIHTAEGAARTHELTLFFYQKLAGRPVAELNSLTQHPLAVRQDPRSAMLVPFMGFELTAADHR